MIHERIGELAALHVPARGAADRGPLVLLHGLWGGAWIFQDWLEPAADRGWDVWAVSLRGREGSRPVEDLGKVSLQDFARDLQDALAGIGPAAVVGYSMGGLILQMVAADASSRHLVRSAVLLCSLAPRGVAGLSGPVLRRSWRYIPAMIGSRPMLPNRADAGEMLLNAMPPAERDRRYPSFIADSGRASRQIALGSVAVDPAGITCPVLVVSAEHDRISPPSIHPKLVSRYAAAYLPIASHAHLVTIEPGWQAVCAAVLDRLDGEVAIRKD
jgi:pimeloyl-ACP methyl ester carboxylesterase